MRKYKISQGCRMYKVIDNFLNHGDFEKIVNTTNNANYKWVLWEKANTKSQEGQFQFAHVYIQRNTIIESLDDNVVYLIMKKLTELYKKTQAVTRARTNLFLKTDNPIGFGYHKDIEDSKTHETILYYLEDSNGCTQFKTGEKIESKANRALIFPAHIEHQTLSHTDIIFRKNVNINFREA